MKKLFKILDLNLNSKELDDILEDVIQSKYDAELKEDWAKKLEQSFDVSKGSTDRKISFWRTRLFSLVIGMAAAFLVLVIALHMFSPFSETPQSLASSYIEALDISHPGFNKGVIEATTENRKNAMKAFNEHNYMEATRYFSLIKSQHKSAQDVYFTGLASLLSENYEEAIQQFTLVPTTKEAENYIAGSNWFLSLSLLLNGEEENAKIVLADIIKSGSSSSSNHDKAQTLLNAIK